VSRGSSININMKIGLFSIRNGYMSFKNDSKDDTRYKGSEDKGEKIRSSTVRESFN